jgi:hypothetical protein
MLFVSFLVPGVYSLNNRHLKMCMENIKFHGKFMATWQVM